MQTVWVVEKNSTPYSIAMELMGDFAVRRIASLATLLRMRQLESTGKPDIVVFTETGESKELLAAASRDFNGVMQFIMPDLANRHCWIENFLVVNLPFCPIEFVRTARANEAPPQHRVRNLKFGDLELNLVSQRVNVISTNELLAFTKKELLVLTAFLRNPGKCIEREDLLREVWEGVRVSDRSIDAQICRLRKLIGNYGLTISCVYGQGYVLE